MPDRYSVFGSGQPSCSSGFPVASGHCRTAKLLFRSPSDDSSTMTCTAKSSNRSGTQNHHMPSNSRGRPAGSDSPTGRMPHDRSRVAVNRSGVTATVPPSNRSSPSQVPTPANRDASSRIRSPSRRTCCGSAIGPYSDR